MNNKGFAVSGILYTVLLVFLCILMMLLFNFEGKKNILDKIKSETLTELTGEYTNYTKYANGTAIYFNPETGKICSESLAISTTGTKTGCMKWYIFNDTGDESSVNMILDHNTTAVIAWNSTGSNVSGPTNILTQLASDTSSWIGLNNRTDNYSVNNGTATYTINYNTYKARLITTAEIATITGNSSFVETTTTTSNWFYFDSNNQTQTVSTIGSSNYDYLFDYTNGCTSYGCNIADASNYGYWTSTAVPGVNYAWFVNRVGTLDGTTVSYAERGVRPVITIPKSLFKSEICDIDLNQSYTFNYTGSSQTFNVPCSGNYKIELWGSQGGGNTTSGKGAYTKGTIDLIKSNNLYVYVGNMPARTENSFNGGGQANNTYYPTDDGGGSTDIRLVATSTPTIWNEDLSLKSRIMVAGSGGGFEAYRTGAQGGSGGGLIGYDGLYTTTGLYKIPTGGTQISGGIRDTSVAPGHDGIFGAGGNGNLAYGGGGGGSGYYGGGGGGNYTHVSSGAGGSSYISGHTGCVAITSATSLTPKTGCTTGTTDNNCSLHYSGLTFANTVMIDGSGYNWTNIKGSLINMPTKDGIGTMTGNSGNGYAKITYLGK